MNNKQGGFKIGHYDIELDLTEVLTSFLDTLTKQREKYLSDKAQEKFSGHDVELVRIVAQVFPEFAKSVISFHQSSLESHQRALKISKLLSFKSASWIQEEATRLAWEDTRQMLREVSILQDPSIKAVFQNHKEILQKLSDVFVELIKEQGNRIDLDLDALMKFLEG